MGRDRGGRGRSLQRRVAVRRPRKTLAIFCEGERTEPEYFEVLRRLPEVRDVAAVDIRIDSKCAGFAPLALVRAAVAARARSLQVEGEVDEFWCVFDVEWPKNHPGLEEAVALAKLNEINLAVSNPCFELWLALHFKDHRGWLDNDDARRLRRACDGQVDKGLVGGLYMPKRGAAASRAVALDRMHAKNATPFPHDNPSSGVHLILASLAVSENG